MLDEELKILKNKIAMYEGFLHDINMFASIAMDGIAISELINNACNWSYAHRVGNGEYSEEEQDEIIKKSFDKLRNVSSKEERKKKREMLRDKENG